jgi:hypothetical protein
MHGHFRGEDRVAGPDIGVPSKLATVNEDDPFLAVDVLSNECVIDCGTFADHRTRHVVDARAVAVLRSITGAVGALSAVRSTREEEPRFAITVSTPVRVHAGVSIRALQQLALIVATGQGSYQYLGKYFGSVSLAPAGACFPTIEPQPMVGGTWRSIMTTLLLLSSTWSHLTLHAPCRYIFALPTSQFRQNPGEVAAGTANNRQCGCRKLKAAQLYTHHEAASSMRA